MEEQQKNYFSLAEANAMIPQLEKIFTRLLQIFPQVHIIYTRLEKCGFAPRDREFNLDPPEASPEVIDDLSTLRLLMNGIKTEIQPVMDKGCVVKDIELGLVDWYAKKDGRDIFLCWKYGEKEVTFWHETDAGYSARRSLNVE